MKPASFGDSIRVFEKTVKKIESKIGEIEENLIITAFSSFENYGTMPISSVVF